MSESGEWIWILTNYSACSGCRLCEVACSIKHERAIWPAASRITVYEYLPGRPTPVYCVQCPDYPCVSACPFGALKVNEGTGAVVVEESLCTLCGRCIEACPGGVPKIVKEKPHVLICDLCSGDPECVKACERAGYNALKVIKRPGTTGIKHYARPPAPREIT